MGHTRPPISTELNVEVPLSGDPSISLDAVIQYRIEIMQQLGDGQPYERGRIVHEARLYMAQSAEAILEAGRRLIILKENEPHGDFVGIVEERPGLHARAAQRMMRVFLRCPSPKLGPKATTLSLLGKARLFELVTEDSDDLVELTDGGAVTGLALDDADRMSVRELRQALREARGTNVAQQRMPANKSEKIDSLSTKLEKESRIQLPEPDEEVGKLWAEVTTLTVEAEPTIVVRLSSTFGTLCAYCTEDMIGTPRDSITGLVCQLGNTARSLRSISGLLDELTGSVAPS